MWKFNMKLKEMYLEIFFVQLALENGQFFIFLFSNLDLKFKSM